MNALVMRAAGHPAVLAAGEELERRRPRVGGLGFFGTCCCLVVVAIIVVVVLLMRRRKNNTPPPPPQY